MYIYIYIVLCIYIDLFYQTRHACTYNYIYIYNPQLLRSTTKAMRKKCKSCLCFVVETKQLLFMFI